MRYTKRIISLTAIATLLFTSGCETIGDFLLGAVRNAAEDAIQAATSQVVGNMVDELGSSLQRIAIGGDSVPFSP